MSQKAKKEYVEAIRGRYQEGNREEKGRILGEFCAVCGLHRKHAVRVLNKAPKQGIAKYLKVLPLWCRSPKINKMTALSALFFIHASFLVT